MYLAKPNKYVDTKTEIPNIRNLNYKWDYSIWQIGNGTILVHMYACTYVCRKSSKVEKFCSLATYNQNIGRILCFQLFQLFIEHAMFVVMYVGKGFTDPLKTFWFTYVST